MKNDEGIRLELLKMNESRLQMMNKDYQHFGIEPSEFKILNQKDSF